MNTVDQDLQKVLSLQWAFKSETLRTIAVRIIQFSLTHEFIWPDQIEHDDIDVEDRNCIGTVFKLLANAKLLLRGDKFRRSTAEGARGRTIFCYHPGNRRLAETFLKRNSAKVPTKQLQLI